MVGYVQDAVANALKKWEPLTQAFVSVVRATDGASVVINTDLPAIFVHVLGEDSHGNTYLGGGIRQYFELTLHYVAEIYNYTFSPDAGLQAKALDLSDEIIRCIELTSELDEVKHKHDLNLQFDRMETETAYATKIGTGNSVTVDVHKVIYKGDVEFDLNDEGYNRYVELMKVIIEEKTTGVKTIIE